MRKIIKVLVSGILQELLIARTTAGLAHSTGNWNKSFQVSQSNVLKVNKATFFYYLARYIVRLHMGLKSFLTV